MNTSERWKTIKDNGRPPGSLLILAEDGSSYEMYAPRARRVVACINACLGMRDPEREIAKLKKRTKQ